MRLDMLAVVDRDQQNRMEDLHVKAYRPPTSIGDIDL